MSQLSAGPAVIAWQGAPQHCHSIEVVEREQKRMTLFQWKEENMTPAGSDG
jgi:hypothetical protein